ncbi:MAG: hypothetical protein U0641_09010 [Anaerolineae bacterium]
MTFRCLETLQRLLARRAMHALARRRPTPRQHIDVGLRQARRRAAAQEVALDVVHATLLDFALVLRRAYPTRRNQEAVMLSALAVGLLHLGFVALGVDNRCFEVVDDQPLGHAAEELEGLTVAGQPRRELLVKDELDVLVAAEGQRHDEGPAFPPVPAALVEHAAGVAKVNLGFFTWWTLDADDHVGRVRFEGTHKAIDGGIAAGVAPFLEAFSDGADLGSRLAQLDDQGAIRLNRGDDLGRRRARERLSHQALQLFAAAAAPRASPGQPPRFGTLSQCADPRQELAGLDGRTA